MNGAFYTGSISFSGINYKGFVAVSNTTITHLAIGQGEFTQDSPDNFVFPATASLGNPGMVVAAGTEIPLKFSGMKGSGAVVAYK